MSCSLFGSRGSMPSRHEKAAFDSSIESEPASHWGLRCFQGLVLHCPSPEPKGFGGFSLFFKWESRANRGYPILFGVASALGSSAVPGHPLTPVSPTFTKLNSGAELSLKLKEMLANGNNAVVTPYDQVPVSVAPTGSRHSPVSLQAGPAGLVAPVVSVAPLAPAAPVGTHWSCRVAIRGRPGSVPI
jgi:hypothetical protein